MTEDLVFGRVEVKPGQRQLRVHGAVVPLGARAYDVMLALIERRDRVVSKAELLDLAWPGLVVEENNLSVQISALRKALGAQAIATVTGRGYRFALTPDKPTVSAAADAASRIVRRLTTLAYGEVNAWQQHARDTPESAIPAWRSIRTTLIEAGVPSMGGRIIELAPEGVWIEFASAVDALRWAIDMQAQLRDHHASPGGPRLHFRIAISVEDVIVDEGRPVGEAGQAPARLLAAAPVESAIVVSDCVRSIVRERLPLRFTPLGGPSHGWQAEPDAISASAGHRLSAASFDLPQQRPTVAVLPFGSGSDAAYFGDGITEEIIAVLASNRSLLVIARSSTLRYRTSELPPAQIAAELGVRYLLCGTVRRAERRLRLVAELVDAHTHRVIWSQRYDGADDDLFGFQSEIASSIAGAIDPRVTEAEIERVARVPTESMSAYDNVLRGLSLQVTFRDDDFAAAGEHFRRALELDPGYAQALAHLAWWHNLRVGEGRSNAVAEDAQASEQLSMRAMTLDPRDALVVSIAAHIQGFVKRRLTVAMEMFEQALAINPSCAFGWARSATAAAFLGRGDEAQLRIRNAMRLSPFDQQGFTFLTTNGTASLVLGRYDEAIAWYGKARRANPGYRAAWRMQVAALALAGELNEAREQAVEFIQYDSAFRVGDFATWYPMCEPHLSTVLQGMRLAGLPE